MLKPGGRIAYFNIFVAEDLPEERRRWAAKEIGSGAYTRATQRGLLRSAGFVRVQETDVTAEFARTQRAFFEASVRHERALRRVQGDEAFEQRQSDRRNALRALELGLLRRALFVAERPESRRT